MHPDIEELLDLIAARMSIEEVMDLLGMEFYEVLEAIKPQINDNYDVLLKAAQ